MRIYIHIISHRWVFILMRKSIPTTKGTGYLRTCSLRRCAPPLTPHNLYLPKSSLSIGLDKDKLNVPPRFSLRYYAVMGIRLGPMRTYYNRGSVYTFTLLVLESILAIDIVPHCTQLCLYESTIYAEVSVVSHAGGDKCPFSIKERFVSSPLSPNCYKLQQRLRKVSYMYIIIIIMIL